MTPGERSCRSWRSRAKAFAAPRWVSVALMCVCAPAAAQDVPTASGCSWQVVQRQSLALPSGAHAYVEPGSVSVTPRGILLLGSPSYVWARGYDSDSVVSRDSIVGVVVSSVGAASAVTSPVPGAEMGSMSAVGNEDGTWSVAFTLLRPGTSVPGGKIAGQIGYGLYDGTEWRDVETEPLPGDVSLNPTGHAGLARGTKGVLWALPTRAAAANAGVAVLRRPMGDWLLHVEAPSRVFGLSAAYIPSQGAVVAVARADTVGQAPRGSLSVESAEPGKPKQDVLTIDPGAGNLWDPVFDRRWNPHWLGWLSGAPGGGLEARAAPLHPRRGPRTVVVLDPNSVALHPIGPLGDGASYWVSHHGAGEGEIRLARSVEARAETVFSMPNPYDGPFGAVAKSPFRVLLTGPLRARDERSPPVTTLLLEVQRRCRG